MNTPAYDILNRPFVSNEVDVLDHFSAKGFLKKAGNTIKNVASDSGKLLANAATTGIRSIQGKEPLYTADEMKTGLGKVGSQVQSATGKASKAIVGNFVPGGQQLIDAMDPSANQSGEFIPDAPPVEDQKTIGDFITENPIAVGAGVFAFILLLILILK